jgi:hypothetical protein
VPGRERALEPALEPVLEPDLEPALEPAGELDLDKASWSSWSLERRVMMMVFSFSFSFWGFSVFGSESH